MADSKHRVIGRWFIGETLGKGGYSWVKKGKDIKTGKAVALKFMEKADSSWIKEQASQVETEIGALKNIRHKNVMKLYAYNLNAQYPLKERGKYVETILLVLEYAPGGELFDILYYTSKLELKVARSYFQQFILGLDACHKANVVHRDLKPQNLLLDSKYNLKITDFGLSKVIQSDKDAVMKTSYVGTRGYQAPELLRKEKYDLKCDIFSAGVILFILLAGYPPFEQASKDDKWFKPLMKGNTEKFWKAHTKSACAQDPDLRNLLERMMTSDPKKRITLKEVCEHKWFTGKTLTQPELISALKRKHRKANEARRADVRKMKDLNNSINPNRAIPKVELLTPDEFPGNKIECFWSYGDSKEWQNIYNFVEEQVAMKQGNCIPDYEDKSITCTMSLEGDGTKHEIQFFMKIYLSREWKNRLPQQSIESIKMKKEDVIFAIDIKRLEGDRKVWRNNILNHFLLKECSYMIKGLPKWAQSMEKKFEKEVIKEEKENKEDVDDPVKDDDDDDEYSKLASEIEGVKLLEWNETAAKAKHADGDVKQEKEIETK